MKKIILLLLGSVSIQESVFSQIIGNFSSDASSTTTCNSNLNVSFSAELETQVSGTIQWGDGSFDETDTVVSATEYSNSFAHSYATDGTYLIIATFNDTLGNTFSDTTSTTCGNLRVFNAFSFSDSLSCISSFSVFPAHTSGNLTLQVNWGDGETSTEVINDVSQITDYESMYPIFHRYHSAGHFQVVVNAISNLSPDTVFVDTLFIGSSGGTCGRFPFHVYVDVNNDHVGDSPFDQQLPLLITNNIGQTDTVFWLNSNYFTTQAVDIYAAPYTVNLDTNWLNTNGYSAYNFQPIVIDTFDMYGSMISFSDNIILNTSPDFYGMPTIETHSQLQYLSPCYQDLFLSSDFTTGTTTGTIDWGDGTVDNIENSQHYNFWSISTNTITFESHHYEIAGNYTITTHFSNTSMPDSIFSSTLSIFSNGPNCGSIPLIIKQSDDTTVNNESVSIYAINVHGDTLNFEYNDPLYGEYSFPYFSELNVDSIPYTIGVRQSWLSNNGLVLDSISYQTVNAFHASGIPIEGPLKVKLSCNPLGVAGGDARVEFAIASALAPTESGELEVRICTSSCNQENGIFGIMIDHEALVNFSASTAIYPDMEIYPNQTFLPINNLEGCETITLPFTLPGSTQAGYLLNFHLALQVDSLFVDQNMANNQMDITGIVMNSYDPNNKICTNPSLTEHTIEKIGYRINFQNDGNYPALNIVVVDTISVDLDLATIKLIAGSHHVSMEVDSNTRVVRFVFNAINLPGYDFDPHLCKGHVDFTIDEVSGLGMGSSVFNTAYIYFDFNPAIITNTAEGKNINKKVVSDLGKNVFDSFTLYPNPASALFQIVTDGFVEVALYDITGKMVLLSKTPAVKIADLSNGMYQVVVKTNTGIGTKKLIIQH
jgi:hypothetical protein